MLTRGCFTRIHADQRELSFLEHAAQDLRSLAQQHWVSRLHASQTYLQCLFGTNHALSISTLHMTTNDEAQDTRFRVHTQLFESKADTFVNLYLQWNVMEDCFELQPEEFL